MSIPAIIIYAGRTNIIRLDSVRPDQTRFVESARAGVYVAGLNLACTATVPKHGLHGPRSCGTAKNETAGTDPYSGSRVAARGG
jgi:hypothetical protein